MDLDALLADIDSVPEQPKVKREASFPKVWISKFANGSYRMRLLPKHPQKNPIGCVVVKQISILADPAKEWAPMFPDPTYGHDAATKSDWFVKFRKLVETCSTRSSFSKELDQFCRKLNTEISLRIPVILFAKSNPVKKPNGYTGVSYSEGTEPVGIILEVSQKTLREAITSQFKMWHDAGTDITSDERGIYWTLQKSDKTYAFTMDPKEMNSPMPAHLRALYQDNKYPDVDGWARKDFKPVADVVQQVKEVKWAVEQLLKHGIDISGAEPAMIPPSLGLQLPV
jgi:hypothetical protein